ncbi:MAG: hypothetical protein LBR26_16810 [Prevotella sp.]|jgi:hypothetical protein|nr:hypothetical protein [Prevotella sp.]
MENLKTVLNSILRKINEPTLTDEEFATLNFDDVTCLYEQYKQLAKVLRQRGDETNALDKLKLQAKINGVDIRREKNIEITNIFIGGSLE